MRLHAPSAAASDAIARAHCEPVGPGAPSDAALAGALFCVPGERAKRGHGALGYVASRRRLAQHAP